MNYLMIGVTLTEHRTPEDMLHFNLQSEMVQQPKWTNVVSLSEAEKVNIYEHKCGP